MKASDVTYRLIKSLSKNEKRYFRLLSKMTSGNKNYLVLFDAMDKLKEYDESILKTSLRHKRFSRNLTYEKNYLRKMILRSLRNFYAADENRLGNTISDLEILTEKKISELFLPLAEKQKSLALDRDALAEYILLSRYELRFVGNMQMGDWFVNYMESGFKADMELIDRYKNSLFIIAKYNELNMLSAKYRFTNKSEFSEKLDKVIDDPMFDGLYQKLPVKGRIAWFNFFTYYHALKYDFNKSYESSVNQLMYIKENKLTIESIGLFNYAASVVSHIENSQHLEKYEEALQYCRQLKTIIFSPPYTNFKTLSEQFEVVYIDAMMHSLAFSSEYAACENFISEMKDSFDRLGQVGGANLEISKQFCLAVSAFGKNNFSDALDHIVSIFNHEKDTPFAYQIYPSRVLYILCHLELGNFEYVSNYLRTFKRYFDKKQIDKITIDAIVKICREFISVSNDRKKLSERSSKWINVIDHIKKDNFERELIRNTRIEQWAKGKISNSYVAIP